MNRLQDNRRLAELVKGDVARLAALARRTKRSMVRARYVTCPVCQEKEFANRHKDDICDACLVDLWSAQNVMAGAYEAGKATGLVPVALTTVAHCAEYPAMPDCELPPAGAPFAVRTSRMHGGVETAARTLQEHFVRLFQSLASVLPVDPQSRQECERFIDGDWHNYSESDEIARARLPRETVMRLRALWRFTQWLAHACYQSGYRDGGNLLQRLNGGDLTADQLTESLADRARAHRERVEKLAKVRT